MTQHYVDDGLLALAPPEASAEERDRAIEARMLARHGVPTLEDYRKVYAACGLDWPGDEEIRRHHRVGPQEGDHTR